MRPNRAKLATAERTPAGVIMVMMITIGTGGHGAITPGVDQLALSPVARWMWATVNGSRNGVGNAVVEFVFNTVRTAEFRQNDGTKDDGTQTAKHTQNTRTATKQQVFY